MFELLANLEWRQPLWFLAALQPLILWLWLHWKQSNKQQNFVDEHLLPWVQVQQSKTFWQKVFSRNTAYSMAWLLFALSLAGPRKAEPPHHSNNEIILDVMLVVDVSRSMQATDIQPSRLRRAVLEIHEFLSLAKNTRVGITIYAGRPHLLVPVTTDFQALKFYLNSLDTLKLPTRGSDVAGALNFAQNELTSTKEKHKQTILWMSDGDIESTDLATIKNTLQEISAQGVDTYIFALATEEGAGIPLAGGNWLEENGQAVISTLNNSLLNSLAKTGNGIVKTVMDDESDWKTLYQQGMMKNLNKVEGKEKGQWRELYQWSLFPAILLLMVALFPLRLRREQINGFAFFFALVAAFSTPSPSYAEPINNEKDYQLSIKQGIGAYQNKQFQAAKSQFIQAVLNAKNKQQRAVALHDLGNSLFQIGDYARAAEVFTDALRYAPKQQQSINNQKLSIAINIELENRRKRLLKRGNLNMPSDSSPLFDLPEQIPYMLNTKAVNLLKASLPKLPDADLDRLLAKNIEQFKLLQGASQKTVEKEKQEYHLEQARIYFMSLEEQQSNQLWKRLFEIEEGFPGKLKKPKNIPGVRPW